MQVITYPLYDQDGYDGDVAMLRLESAVTFSRNIRPVCLPSNSRDTYEKQVELVIATSETSMRNRWNYTLRHQRHL